MATNNDSFEFVLHEPVKGISKVTQTRIRRQAMKAVAAARRQAGQYGKHNLRQSAISFARTDLDLSPGAVPVCIRDRRVVAVHKRSTAAAADGGVDGRDHIPNQANATLAADRQTEITLYRLTSPVPLTDIELFMKQYSVRPADLSALTSIRMAPVAAQAFTTDPRTLKHLLSCRQWSYFEYLYARYGHSPCLDDAIRCLIVVSQAVLAPSSKTSNAAILSHYGTALKSLQNAINDPNRWSDPDTLCAANMLQLFDLLNSGTVTTWSQHISGAMRLLELKGPKSFNSDYEKSILVAVAGMVASETFLQNDRAFLEDLEWQEAVRSCMLKTDRYSDRSPLAIHLALLMHRIPGACKRVGDVVCGENPSEAAISTVREEVRRLRHDLRQWRKSFDTELVLDLSSEAVSTSDRYKRLDHLGNALVSEIIVARLLGSVSASERFLMEDEIQESATYIHNNMETSIRNDYRTGLYLSQKAMVGVACVKTSHLWRAPCVSELIEPWKFVAWCDAVPRKSPQWVWSGSSSEAGAVTVPNLAMNCW